MSDLYIDFNILRQNEEVDNPGTELACRIRGPHWEPEAHHPPTPPHSHHPPTSPHHLEPT